MKSILPTIDTDQIKGILMRDDIYDSLAYDGSPSLQDYVPIGLWFILCQNDIIAGMINLVPLNNVTWQPHIFIFEQYRGNDSYHWGKLILAEMPGVKFLAMTPYVTAKKYAEKIGFNCIGILGSSIRKNGKLLDQYILEK